MRRAVEVCDGAADESQGIIFGTVHPAARKMQCMGRQVQTNFYLTGAFEFIFFTTTTKILDGL